MNNYLITGIYKGMKNKSLLLEINNTIINIDVSFVLKNNILEFVKLDNPIGVKGYISFDNQKNISLTATKIFLLKTN